MTYSSMYRNFEYDSYCFNISLTFSKKDYRVRS